MPFWSAFTTGHKRLSFTMHEKSNLKLNVLHSVFSDAALPCFIVLDSAHPHFSILVFACNGSCKSSIFFIEFNVCSNICLFNLTPHNAITGNCISISSILVHLLAWSNEITGTEVITMMIGAVRMAFLILNHWFWVLYRWSLCRTQ